MSRWSRCHRAQFFNPFKGVDNPRVFPKVFDNIGVIKTIGKKAFPVQGFDVISLKKGFGQEFPVCRILGFALMEENLIGGKEVVDGYGYWGSRLSLLHHINQPARFPCRYLYQSR
jgi:hypothetical protein